MDTQWFYNQGFYKRCWCIWNWDQQQGIDDANGIVLHSKPTEPRGHDTRTSGDVARAVNHFHGWTTNASKGEPC